MVSGLSIAAYGECFSLPANKHFSLISLTLIVSYEEAPKTAASYVQTHLSSFVQQWKDPLPLGLNAGDILTDPVILLPANTG